jgi:hypothetical protein
LTTADATEKEHYKKVVINEETVDRLLVQTFLESYAEPPAEIVLDLDAADDPLYRKQEGRFFHGYYGNCCYQPLSSSKNLNIPYCRLYEFRDRRYCESERMPGNQCTALS